MNFSKTRIFGGQAPKICLGERGTRKTGIAKERLCWCNDVKFIVPRPPARASERKLIEEKEGQTRCESTLRRKRKRRSSIAGFLIIEKESKRFIFAKISTFKCFYRTLGLYCMIASNCGRIFVTST